MSDKKTISPQQIDKYMKEHPEIKDRFMAVLEIQKQFLTEEVGGSH